MQNLGKLLVALCVSAGAAHAEGIDRSGQDIGFMFEKGGYAALSFSSVRAVSELTPEAVYGDVAGDYVTGSFALKMDMTDRLSFGVMVDQPYGLDTSYSGDNISMNVDSRAITALARYLVSDDVSLHGGLSVTRFDLQSSQGGTTNSIQNATDIGYVLGAAWQRPEDNTRLAVTYFSGNSFTKAGAESQFPAAVNIDAQTGVGTDTLVFGSLRWADWSQSHVRTFLLDNSFNSMSFGADVVTTTLGLQQKFSETWSGSVTLGYAAPQGDLSQLYITTDGQRSIGLGLTYRLDKFEITGDLAYTSFGDTTPVGPPGEFLDSTAASAGLKIAYRF
jgi:long-chain fatty acid transport protein